MPYPRRNCLALLCLLLFVPIVSAHSVGASARIEGDQLRVEAYFDDNTPAAGATVQMVDDTQTVVAQGKTDAKGEWTVAVPQPGRYRILIDAGGGHHGRSIFTVPAREGQTAGAPGVNEGPGRDEFTRFPWERVALGLGVIALLGLGWWGTRRLSRPGTPR